jgi:hypothetical protein
MRQTSSVYIGFLACISVMPAHLAILSQLFEGNIYMETARWRPGQDAQPYDVPLKQTGDMCLKVRKGNHIRL